MRIFSKTSFVTCRIDNLLIIFYVCCEKGLPITKITPLLVYIALEPNVLHLINS